MKLILIILINITSLGFISAQVLDKLIVSYDSNFEKKNFEGLESKSALDLLLSLDPQMNDEIRDEIQNEIQNLKTKLLKKKFLTETPKNQAKILQKYLHGKLLKYYTSISPFHRIFEDGQYNCVSSTALYALILEELSISYVIKEQPNHVYLIIYPNSHRIKIETTASKHGLYFNRGLNVEKTVSWLVAQELIDESEVESKGVQKVFNDIFFTDSTITLKQLTGIQYTNESIVNEENEDLRRAVSSILKAYQIFPSKGNLMLKQSFLEFILRPMEFDDFEDLAYLKEYCNLKLVNDQNIKYKLYYYFNTNLMVNENKKLVDSAYHYLYNNISNETNRNALSECYYIGLSEYYSSARNYKNVLKYNLKALEINSENSYIVSRAAESVSFQVYDLDSYDYYNNMSEEELDTIENKLTSDELRFLLLDKYIKQYPSIAETSAIKSLLFYIYAGISVESFDENDEKKGLEFMQKAKNQLKNIEDKDLVNGEMHGWIYSSAGAYYYRKGQLKKALDYIYEGLIISPDHPRLLAKKKIIEGKVKG